MESDVIIINLMMIVVMMVGDDGSISDGMMLVIDYLYISKKLFVLLHHLCIVSLN